MALRFSCRLKILPGVSLNIGKTGVRSVSVGARGAHAAINRDAITVSTGIPGTGLSWRQRLWRRIVG